MKRITVLFLLLAVVLLAASAASSATAATKRPVLRCLCEGESGGSDTDVLRAIRPFAYGPGLFRATPTVRAAGSRIPGGVYRAALQEDPDAFSG